MKGRRHDVVTSLTIVSVCDATRADLAVSIIQVADASAGTEVDSETLGETVLHQSETGVSSLRKTQREKH